MIEVVWDELDRKVRQSSHLEDLFVIRKSIERSLKDQQTMPNISSIITTPLFSAENAASSILRLNGNLHMTAICGSPSLCLSHWLI